MADKTADKTTLEELMALLAFNRADENQAMTYAAVDNFVRQSKDLLHSSGWHREQVNALLKRNYEECGHPEAYNPPEEPGQGEGDGVDNNSFFNNTIISDKAAEVLVKAIGGDDNSTPTPTDPPVDPPVQPPPPARPQPAWWKVVLGTLAAVLLGAILVWLSWKAFGQQPRYEIIAEPFEPPELLEFQT